MTEVKVLPVPEGSIIWLHNVMGVRPDGQPDDRFDIAESLLTALREKIGHDRFVVLTTEGEGVVEVLGPDELVARVNAALEPARETCSSTTSSFGSGRPLGCVLPPDHWEVMHEDSSGARWVEDEDGASIVESG